MGVGTNDANYVVVKDAKINGKFVRVWTCPYYRCWYNMLKRCYNAASLLASPTYAGCVACDEWLLFSNFKSWMEKQDWEGKVLDKDLLVKGSKVYSPETCVFISAKINTLITGTNGVSFDKERNLYKAYISIDDRYVHLGRYASEQEAYARWLSKKHELSCESSLNEKDPAVKLALQTRYINNT